MRITDKNLQDKETRDIYVNKPEKEFWFIVGSQHLYGDEALKK